MAPVYAEIRRQAILTVKAPDVAKFLGKRLSPEAELTSDFRTRIEGTRLKHALGPASLKLYDKRGRVLAAGMPRQRRHLFSTLPQGRTPRRTADLSGRRAQEVH